MGCQEILRRTRNAARLEPQPPAEFEPPSYKDAPTALPVVRAPRAVNPGRSRAMVCPPARPWPFEAPRQTSFQTGLPCSFPHQRSAERSIPFARLVRASPSLRFPGPQTCVCAEPECDSPPTRSPHQSSTSPRNRDMPLQIPSRLVSPFHRKLYALFPPICTPSHIQLPHTQSHIHV